jgi:hypothetical protein
MADIDLNDPEHLAELLRAGLRGFNQETAETVTPLVDALASSDNDMFALVGRGKRKPEQSPEQQAGPEQQQQQQQQQQPLDMGGEGLLIDDQVQQGPAAELAPVVIARRGWTEIDRVRAKGKHEVYTLAAKHERSRPIRSVFTGSCQAVRVRLPEQKPAADAFIGTWVGTVEAKDHLLFSVEEVQQRFVEQFGAIDPIARVDLITGARFRGRRFSPVSIYLAYRELDGAPIFYFLEGGSAAGKPKALYLSGAMDHEIKAQSGFSFTPFACSRNWYEGGLAMTDDMREPACVYLTAAQHRDGRNEYIELVVGYARDHELDRVTHPFELQVEAAMRVLAIADEMHCKLKVGSGGVLQHSLGPAARALIQWDEAPNGTTTPLERDTFCGCPKT